MTIIALILAVIVSIDGLYIAWLWRQLGAARRQIPELEGK